MWNRRAQCGAIGVLAMALTSSGITTLQARQDLPASLASAVAGFTTRQLPISEVDPAVDLRLVLKPGADNRAERLIDVTGATLRTLSLAFGAFPHRRLSIVDMPWQSPLVGESHPGTVVIGSRWITIERDGAMDRLLIGALSRQYWFGVLLPEQRWFEEALGLYSSNRTIEAVLQGRQYWSRRYLGGFLPYAVRSMPLSPPRSKRSGYVLRYDDAAPPAADARAAQAALSLHSLERYLGWPALQQGLEAYRDRFRGGGGTIDALAAILNEQGGRDLSWFFAEAFKPGARFDYGIDRFTTEADGAHHRIVLDLRRLGNGVFAGTSAPRAMTAGRGIPVRIQLADGTEIREWWDGRDDSRSMEFTSTSAPIIAEVDPERMLLLDNDRSNNIRRLTAVPPYPPLQRAVVSWVVWLQDLMLACAALA